jgi:hypothetical protein
MSRLPTTKDCLKCGPGKQHAKGVSVFRVWDLCRLSKSRFNHHKGGWTSKKKRINITVRAGALMDLTALRNIGFSGCVAWKKLRLNILSH